MDTPRTCGIAAGLALVLVCVVAGGCAGPASESRPLQQLLLHEDQAAAKQCFLDLLSANGLDEEFRLALNRPEAKSADFTVEEARTMPGTNGLVYVRVRPNTEPPEEFKVDGLIFDHWYWFFFDRSGRLLSWADNNSGFWVLEDVTGEGTKDLLVARERGMRRPSTFDNDVVTDYRIYYTLFRTSRSNPIPFLFGYSWMSNDTHGFTLINVPNSSIPLVMTYEGYYPLKDSGENLFNWAGTVVRSFKGGTPKVILAVKDSLRLRVGPDMEVQLWSMDSWRMNPKDDYHLTYDERKREFRFEGDETGEKPNPVDFSTTVP
jgi:hypothetical protein